ncbi:hypothetical protein BH10ACT1_BH10ACT1_01560 [soil metagenome]
MMRKGPLDEYPAEWVLREAAVRRASGGIEFHTEDPVTVHLHDGRIYFARQGTGSDHGAADRPLPTDEASSRAHVVAILARLLGEHPGWYYLHPLNHHPQRGPWRWETASLLLAARGQHVMEPPAPADEPLATEGVASADPQAEAALAAEATVAHLAALADAHRGATSSHDEAHPGVVDLARYRARATTGRLRRLS